MTSDDATGRQEIDVLQEFLFPLYISCLKSGMYSD